MQNSSCNVAYSYVRLLLPRHLETHSSTSNNEKEIFRKMEECNRSALPVSCVLASSGLAYLCKYVPLLE